jgi:hypothetical protein
MGRGDCSTRRTGSTTIVREGPGRPARVRLVVRSAREGAASAWGLRSPGRESRPPNTVRDPSLPSFESTRRKRAIAAPRLQSAAIIPSPLSASPPAAFRFVGALNSGRLRAEAIPARTPSHPAKEELQPGSGGAGANGRAASPNPGSCVLPPGGTATRRSRGGGARQARRTCPRFEPRCSGGPAA